MKSSNKGLTLITLVVTIIVLLILEGISISMVMAENGIVNKGTEAKELTTKTQIIENVRMDISSKKEENQGDITNEELRTILNDYFKNVPIELPTDPSELNELELTSIDGGHKITLGEIWEQTTNGE